MTSSSGMTERPRKLGGFKGQVTLRLNFTFRHFRANIYGPLESEMAIVQLCCWKFSHKETL